MLPLPLTRLFHGNFYIKIVARNVAKCFRFRDYITALLLRCLNMEHFVGSDYGSYLFDKFNKISFFFGNEDYRNNSNIIFLNNFYSLHLLIWSTLAVSIMYSMEMSTSFILFMSLFYHIVYFLSIPTR